MPRPKSSRQYNKKPFKKGTKRPTKQLLRIPRPISNRQPRAVAMNLVKDFQVYVDPANSVNAIQNGVVITMAVNSLYPFIEDTATGFHPIQKNTQAKVNFEQPIVPYDLGTPNPATATNMPGIYEQGNYSQGRKYERAYISGAKVTCWTTGVDFPGQADSVQAGLFTMMAHNTRVSPFSINSSNSELKLLSPRVTRRIEPMNNSNQFNANIKAKQTQLSLGVSVAKLNHITDINDDLENYGFSLGAATDTGSTTTAGVPLERSYVSINYCPAIKASMSGSNIQAPPCVVRIRLQQRITFVEQRSHAQTPGVNWNLPKPRTVGAGATAAFIAAAMAGY